MNKKMSTIMVLVALIASTAIFAIPMGSESVDAAGGFTITDVEGKTVSFDGPADHVIALGLGLTLTVIELGMKDKIVGVDSYSAPDYSSNAQYRDILEGLTSIGNYYNAGGREQILTTIVQMIDSGKIDAKGLVIIAPNYSYIKSDTDGLIKMMNDRGLDFKIVLLAKSGMMFDDIVPFVKNVGKIVGASDIDRVVADMELVKTEVSKVVAEKGLSDAPAIHLTSSSTPTIYNSSILLSMVDIAGGKNVGSNGTTSGSYATDYAAIVQIIEKHPNVTIFLDEGNPNTVAEFRSKIGNPTGVTVMKMDPTFNNTSPSVSKGLWTVAGALYPEYFDGEIPSTEDDPDNMFLYLAIGIILALVVVGAIVLILRKKGN